MDLKRYLAQTFDQLARNRQQLEHTGGLLKNLHLWITKTSSFSRKSVESPKQPRLDSKAGEQ